MASSLGNILIGGAEAAGSVLASPFSGALSTQLGVDAAERFSSPSNPTGFSKAPPAWETPADNPLSVSSSAASSAAAANRAKLASETQRISSNGGTGSPATFNISNLDGQPAQGQVQNTDPNAPNYQDSYTTQMQQLSQRSDTATQSMIAGIMAQRQQAMNVSNAQATQYQHGLEALGVGSNSAMTTPSLLTGQIQQAEDQQTAKIANINNQYNKAIATAQQAQDNEDDKTLNEQVTYMNQLKTQALDTLKEQQQLYEWSNLSPYQQESLGIQQQNANTSAGNANAITVTQPGGVIADFENYLGIPTSSTATKTPGGGNTSVLIGGNNYTVGSTVYNSSGQAGIVNADGSITPQ